MTIDQINSIVEPVMDLPTLRVGRENYGEWLKVLIPADTSPMDWREADTERDTMRIAVYGLWAMTETVIATGRRTKVYTYRLHHFERR